MTYWSARTAPSPLRLLWLAGLLLAATPGRLAALSATGQAPRDSAALHDAARDARRRFERLRIAALPVTETRGAQACEANVGRFCFWHDHAARPPDPREPERVTMARRVLLATLDSVAVALPRDAWVLGQRIRYLIDAGDTTGAMRVVELECNAGGWRCAAMRGYVRHVAGDHPGAAVAFGQALAQMDSSRRCMWDSPAVLLAPRQRKRLEEIPCASRGAWSSRIWWLATPLLSRGANDFRTEIHARHAAALLEADARHLYDTSWGWDANELLLRYGPPVWWTRERRYALGGITSPALVGHEATPGFDLLPDAELMFDSTRIAAPDDWNPGRERPPSRYAPAYASSWTSADAQVARFVRGDSLLVVASFVAQRDTMLRAPVARLVVAGGPASTHYTSRAVHSGAGVLEVRVPLRPDAAPLLASVEVSDSATGAVARLRTGLARLHTGRLTLSDLLLHAPHDASSAGVRLADVAPHALSQSRLEGQRVGIFWEAYGLPAQGEMLDVAMTIERVDTPWLRRAAARLGLVSRVSPLQIRWKEMPDHHGGAASRSVVVNVGMLEPGEHLVTLTVRGDDGARAERSIVITIAG